MKYQTNKTRQIIEAFQITKPRMTHINEWPKWLKDSWNATKNGNETLFSCTADLSDEEYVLIRTKEGLKVINEDDWIIRTETSGYLTKMSDIDFRNTYVPHVKAPDGCFNRDDFMEYFRSDACSEELSTDDKLEIFLSVLPGQSDITKELLDQLLCEYSVDSLDIQEIRPKGSLAERLEEYNKRLAHVRESLRAVISVNSCYSDKIKQELTRTYHKLQEITNMLYFIINTQTNPSKKITLLTGVNYD